jgi:hypothetical protein
MLTMTETRVLDVQPPSTAAETLGVVRAGLVIVLAASFAIFAPRGGKPASQAWPLLPYQRLFIDLPSADQRVVRSLREAMLEAENSRAQTKAWPEVAALAQQGIPPFAPDPIDRGAYVWSRNQAGLYVNYRGVPQVADRTELLLLFVEPDPSAARMPGDRPPPVDEQHHTLSDGSALHVSLWLRAPGRARDDKVVSFPAADGWTQILSKPVDPTL